MIAALALAGFSIMTETGGRLMLLFVAVADWFYLLPGYLAACAATVIAAERLTSK